MKFSEIFEDVKKGNAGLTDETIYKSIQNKGKFIPIWGGNKEHNSIKRYESKNAKTKYGKPITIFNGEGIILSLDGSAGYMTYKNNQTFALNHHACFFKIKKPNLILPEFFILFYQKILQEKSISDGSKTLSMNQIHKIDFDVPNYQIQKNIMSHIKPMLAIRERLNGHILKINKLQSLNSIPNHTEFQIKHYPINKLLSYVNGNIGLTEKIIYQKILHCGDRYVVLSASTKNKTKLGHIPYCQINEKPLKIFEDEGILIIRKGKAGASFYLEKGSYTITDDAYILYLKNNMYEISLKWLMYKLKPTFLEYASSSDNGTWNMTGFFNTVTVDIPTMEVQIKILSQYEKLEHMKNKSIQFLSEINSILSKQISNNFS